MNRKVVLALTLTLLVGTLNMASNVQPVKAGGTIYIRADGSIDPPTAPISAVDNVTYTLTGNINDNIVVERDNIVVDGAGFILQGTGSGTGIELSGRSSVTIKSIKVVGFTYCIYLNGSFDNNLFGNNIADNGVGIYLGFSSGNSIIGNHLTASRGDGSIYLHSSSRNIINGNNIVSSSSGIYLGFSSNNSIYNNIIAQMSFMSIRLSGSINNTITGNSIIDNERCGIGLYASTKNSIIKNRIINNPDGGIRLGYIMHANGTTSYSRNNVITGNTISNSGEGIAVWHSSANIIYHNNFVNNPNPVFSEESYPNVWDNGYPSGGNYWSNYTDVDADADGIGDTHHIIDANNTDRYPLIAPIAVFDAGIWNEVNYYVDVVSNSTVSDFYFNPSEGAFVRFWISDETQTFGFCRVAIPKDLLWAEDGWTVYVGEESLNATIIPDDDNTYLYFTYNHSTKRVIIQGTHVIPEFPYFLILPLFMIASLLAILASRRKRFKRQIGSQQ